jgi:chromosome segregation ATPase
MSDLFDDDKVDDAGLGVSPASTKVKKTRKPMSDERRAQLKLQLIKARAKSNEVRAKKALAKKIDKEEESKQLDEKIAKKVLNKNPMEDEITALKDEIKSLREQGGHTQEIKELRAELNAFKQGLVDLKKLGDLSREQIIQNEPITVKIEETPPPPEPEKPPPEPEKPPQKFKKVFIKGKGIQTIPI